MLVSERLKKQGKFNNNNLKKRHVFLEQIVQVAFLVILLLLYFYGVFGHFWRLRANGKVNFLNFLSLFDMGQCTQKNNKKKTLV